MALVSMEIMGQILMQAQAQRKTVGFQVSEIMHGSISTKISLQKSDVIQRVNSQNLDDPANFFQPYQGLRHERNIAIDLIRGSGSQR